MPPVLSAKTKKWGWRFYNAAKLIGNIIAYLLICLMLFATLQVMYTQWDNPYNVTISKGVTMTKSTYYLVRSCYALILAFCLWHLSKKVFKIQKLRDHLLFWAIPFLFIFVMFIEFLLVNGVFKIAFL